jgi:hypothetical protein
LTAAGTLALKLVLTPALIVAASLAGRRWGASVGGWLIGIPFTSGPIAFFLALDQRRTFAAAAAAGIMAGAVSQAAFCVVFAWVARRAGWHASLAAAVIAFAAATAALRSFEVSPIGFAAVNVIALIVSLLLIPAVTSRRIGPAVFPRWDLPARMLVATAFVVALTAAAPLLGPRLAGLLAPFPIYGSVLAVFAHRMEGRDAAVAVVRGLVLGLFAFTGFFLAVTLLLPHGLAIAFATAIAVALAVEGLALVAGKRLGVA